MNFKLKKYLVFKNKQKMKKRNNEIDDK